MRPCTCPQVEEEDRTTIAQVIQDAYALYSVVTIYIHATMYMPTGGGGEPNDDRPSRRHRAVGRAAVAHRRRDDM